MRVRRSLAADVHALMQYLAETISGWQAPADDAAARAWREATERTLHETQAMDLALFIGAHLVPFLAAAIERVGAVYKRLVELADARAEERAASTAA